MINGHKRHAGGWFSKLFNKKPVRASLLVEDCNRLSIGKLSGFSWKAF